MDQSTSTTDQSTSTTDQSTSKLINIREIPGWIASNVKDKQDEDNKIPLLLRPLSLRTLYILFYYEYVRYSLVSQKSDKKELPRPENDNDISIPEQLFILLLQIYFDQTSNSYFTNLSTF